MKGYSLSFFFLNFVNLHYVFSVTVCKFIRLEKYLERLSNEERKEISWSLEKDSRQI